MIGASLSRWGIGDLWYHCIGDGGYDGDVLSVSKPVVGQDGSLTRLNRGLFV